MNPRAIESLARRRAAKVDHVDAVFFGTGRIALPDGVLDYTADPEFAAVHAVRSAGFDPRLRESLGLAICAMQRDVTRLNAGSPGGGRYLAVHLANLQALYVQCPIEDVDGDDETGVLEQCEIAIRG